jgi:hypothetical protein
MKDQFNGMTKTRRPPPHLIGHEVYEMVKNVHVVLGKWKRTSKNIEKISCGRSSQFSEIYHIGKT